MSRSCPARIRETKDVIDSQHPSVNELGLVTQNADVAAVLGEDGEERNDKSMTSGV